LSDASDPFPSPTPEDDGAFGPEFLQDLTRLFLWRRDVRHFLPDPIDETALETLFDLACLAPSVGNSQPWRFVRVEDPERRAQIRANFQRSNEQAAQSYDAARRADYLKLKLQGLDQAPVHLAVFCEKDPPQGHGLGRLTMPETLYYSAVTAIHSLWLAARARNIGMGWVSILEPETLNPLLDVPDDWHFIAYLCLGYPARMDARPELERLGWQNRDALCRQVLRR